MFSYNKVFFMTSTLLGSNLSSAQARLILLIYTKIPFNMGYVIYYLHILADCLLLG